MGPCIRSASAFFVVSCLLPVPALAQDRPGGMPTKEQLADDNALFLGLASKALKWEEPAEPVPIAGPIHFVGTQGLGAFLI